MRHALERMATWSALWLVTGVASTRMVHAQGYGLYEQGACQMARAGAGVAAPCDDGSAVFFNPAGLAQQVRPLVSGGVTAIAPRGSFTDSATNLVSTLNAKTYASPTVYAAMPVGHGIVVGAGLFAPYGLTTDWPTSAQGRFLGYYSSVKSLYVQPTIAFRATETVLIGGGLDISHTSVDLRQRLDLAVAPVGASGLTFGAIGVPAGTDFADLRLTGTANHVGAHIGLIVKASDRISIGVRYLTGQRVNITDGTFTGQQLATNLTLRIPLGPTLPAGTPIDGLVAGEFAPGGPLGPQAASTSLPLPDQVVAGMAFAATDRLKLLADYQFTHWQMFDVLTVLPQFAPPQVTQEQYGNTSGVRLGTEYVAGVAIVRGGFDAHTAGAPDQSVTPRLPEAPRWELAAGIGVPAQGTVRVDVAYQYVHQSDRAGRSGDLPNNGLYQYHANLVSLQVVIGF